MSKFCEQIKPKFKIGIFWGSACQKTDKISNILVKTSEIKIKALNKNQTEIRFFTFSRKMGNCQNCFGHSI